MLLNKYLSDSLIQAFQYISAYNNGNIEIVPNLVYSFSIHSFIIRNKEHKTAQTIVQNKALAVLLLVWLQDSLLEN